MSRAVQALSLTRIAATELVDYAEKKRGSRMRAYENVAASVGSSASWIRKFVNGTEAKTPDWVVGWNLLDHCYEMICKRVEHGIGAERTKLLALKRQIDAVTKIAGGMDQDSTREMDRREAFSGIDQTEWP